MGLLDNLLGLVWKKETEDWTFGTIAPGQIAAPFAFPQRPLQDGKEYVNVILRTMRIPEVQRGASKYFGAVHSFLSLDHPILTDHVFHVFTAPTRLRDLDAANLDRVVRADDRLLGPTPYHGGDIRMEMALFSVKSADLSAPFVSLLEGLSATAGTAFLGAAAPLLPLLTNGVKLLTETPGAATLEIGLDRTLTAPSTGCYVAARAPAATTPIDKFSIAQDGKLLDDIRRPVTAYPYIVFTIEGTNNRKDWAKIPDVSQPYGALLDVARKGDQKEAASLFEELKRRARLSFDLVPNDAEFIIKWVEGQLQRALPAAMHAGIACAEMEPLEKLPLYNR
jgi:hypothetical protein